MPLTEDGTLVAPEGITLLLRDLIHERTGIFFDPTRLDTMVDKLQEPARARGSRSLTDYYYLLKYDSDSEHEWARVMDALSVQETYLWREMAQIHVLVNRIVPAWFAQRTTPLRIWSAACATGEEPYTIAIALQEAGWGNHPIYINASDASSAALNKVRQGVYRERSFRALPEELREKYFRRVNHGWEVRPELAGRVRFHRANLVSKTEVGEFATAPVVFCRNVFIYFSPDAIRKTIATFAEFMPAGGHLFVGASESLVKLTNAFELTEIDDAFAYVRGDDRKEKQ